MSVARAAVIVAFLGAWQAVGSLTTLDLWISSPSEIARQLATWWSKGVLLSGTVATIEETLLGFAVGALSGLIAGAVFGSIRKLGALLEPFILALYSIPKIALAPLFVLWFGIDMLPKVMLAALLVFFLVFFSVYQGFLTVDQELMGVSRLMGARRLDIIVKVSIPYAAAWMFSGLKMGLPYALIGAVVGEFMASTKGLGYLILNASSVFNTTGVFAGLLALMVISTVLTIALSAIERRVLHWSGKGI